MGFVGRLIFIILKSFVLLVIILVIFILALTVYISEQSKQGGVSEPTRRSDGIHTR